MIDTPPEPSELSRPRSLKGLWVLAFVFFAALYGLTAQRSFPWQDSGVRHLQVSCGDLRGDMGLALAHPMYVLISQPVRLLPKQHFALALNAFSGLGMAIALANLAVIVTVLTSRRWVGLLAAAMLAVCHTVWWLSTVAETYTWSVAGLTTELLLLVFLLRRPNAKTLALLALVNGLGLCVHNMALLPLPVYIAVAIWLVRRRELSGRAALIAAGAYVLGASLYLGLTVELAIRSGDPLMAIKSALFGGHYGDEVLNVSGASRFLKANAALGAMNLVSFLAPLAVIGWARLRRWMGTPLAVAIAAITVIEVLFVVRYPVPDQFMFLLPSLVMMALAAGLGVATLATTSRRWRGVAIGACVISILLPPAFYAWAPSLAQRSGVNVQRGGASAFRDELRYWLVPWKQGEDSAEIFAARALGQAEPDGIIFADNTSRFVLILTQWRDDLAPGVAVQVRNVPLPPYGSDPDAFRAALGDRQLYAVSGGAGYLSKRLLGDVRVVDPGDGQVLHRLEFK